MKPSFGQVLGYIQEGEPLALDLPKRNASIYTSSHFYLDDYPNAPEPVSDAPLPHTTLNPAAAFETADEGYDGVPFPRPPREFTRPSFLPDSDDGGTDPGQALRNDGLNPPRPPTLGGRMRESGIQAAEAIMAGGAAGAAAAVRSVSENQTMNLLRGGGDWLDRTLRIPRRPPGLAPRKRKHPRAFATAAEAAAGAAEAATRQRPVRELWRCWAREPWRRREPWVPRREAWRWWEQVLPSSARRGPSKEGSTRLRTSWAWGRCNGRRHGFRRSRPSTTTDVQTLNNMQESGAVDHYFIQEQRRAQRSQPEVFRIDTESESEPRNRPLPQIRSRPARRPRPQVQTPFGLKQRSHSRVLGQRTVPGQQAVPRRPGTPRNPALLRRASSGERTGSCIGM